MTLRLPRTPPHSPKPSRTTHTGFIAEIAAEGEEHEFQYQEHVRTWCSVLFEFRKNVYSKSFLEAQQST